MQLSYSDNHIQQRCGGNKGSPSSPSTVTGAAAVLGVTLRPRSPAGPRSKVLQERPDNPWAPCRSWLQVCRYLLQTPISLHSRRTEPFLAIAATTTAAEVSQANRARQRQAAGMKQQGRGLHLRNGKRQRSGRACEAERSKRGRGPRHGCWQPSSHPTGTRSSPLALGAVVLQRPISSSASPRVISYI